MALQHTLTVYINPTTNPTTHEDNTALTNVALNATYTADGVLVFDEVAKLLYVKGVAYGLSATQATNLSTALSTANTLKGDDTGKSARTIAGEVSAADITAALGTSFGTGEGKYETVTAAITVALTAASDASTAASTAQSTADSKIANVTGYKTGTTDDDLIEVTVDSNHVANVKSKQALTDAVTAATGAVQSATINGVVLTKNGTQLSGRLGSTDINYSEATEAQGTEGQDDYVAPQGAVTLKSKIDDLETAINTLVGGSDTNTSLTEVLSKITAIEDELKANDNTDGSSDLSTIIDSLRTLKIQTTTFTGINSDGTPGAQNNSVALQTSLNNLKTYADNLIANLDEIVYGADGATGTTGASATTNYANDTTHKVAVKVTEVDGKITAVDVKTNDIASAATLSSVQTIANTAKSATDTLNGDSGTTGSLAKAVADLKGTKAAGDTTDETIRGAKDYADAVAATAADNAANTVISWITIGDTGATGA